MDQDNYNFFLVVPPGLETIALKELNQKFLLPGRVVYGGIELDGPLERGAILNHYLKIPSKVLLRIDEFKCRDFPKLFQSLKKIKLQKILPNKNFRIKVACSKSRLLNEKRVLNIASEVFAPELNESKYVHTVFIRMYEDICTVSVDTTGELLYKRGEKELINLAPIRENLAAGMLLMLLNNTDSHHEITLMDPMCGSGTFLLEAFGLYKPILTREFSYQKFIKKIRLPPLVDLAPTPVKELIGYDWDDKCIKIAKENLKNISCNIEIRNRNFFKDLDVKDFKGKNLYIVSNPPYGKKIKLPCPPKEYYLNWLETAIRLNPTAIGCVVPAQYSNIKLKNSEYGITDQLKFQNGGIDVVFNVYKRSI